MLKAKTQLLFNQPFFATLLFKLKFRERPDIPTMQTDSIHLDYSPEFVGTMNVAETMGVLVHEVLHCALNHCSRDRVGSRNQKKWGRAIDYVVNPLVLNANLQLPGIAGVDYLYDTEFLNKTAEHVYDLLPDLPTDDQPEPDLSNLGDIAFPTNEDGTPLSSGQISQLEGEWKMAVKAATETAKQRGNLPANFEELIEELTREPQVDWRDEMYQFMVLNDRSDYSWSRSNRKFVSQGIYLPSLFAPAMGEIVWVTDSSASVSQEEFEVFGSEFNEVAQELHPERIHFMWCDTRLHGIEELTMSDMPIDKMKPMGRGGTSFDAPFEWVRDNNIRPDCLVYLTDLEGRCTVEPPDYPVLWVNTDRNYGQHSVPFGKVIDVIV